MDEIDATQPGWHHRQLRPRSLEETADIVRTSSVVSTHNSIHEDAAVPNRVRNIVIRDHLLTRLIVVHDKPDGPDCEPEFDKEWHQEFNARKEERRLAIVAAHERLSQELAAEPLPDVTHIAVHTPPSIEHFPEDQVVVVRGPVQMYNLRKKLAESGQCIPHASYAVKPGGIHSIVHGDTPQRVLDFNLPHALQAQCGSWRDWVLGMTVVLADGTIAKTGSQAVKNVAGYDVHKLFIGARSTLGIVCDVILRTFPLSALPTPDIEVGPFGARFGLGLANPPLDGYIHRWIQRTKPSDFAAAVRSAGERLLSADHASSTLWAIVPPEESVDRFSDDWVVRTHCGEKNLEISDPTQIRLMKRTKEIFDPTHKLNPGEMGIF